VCRQLARVRFFLATGLPKAGQLCDLVGPPCARLDVCLDRLDNRRSLSVAEGGCPLGANVGAAAFTQRTLVVGSLPFMIIENEANLPGRVFTTTFTPAGSALIGGPPPAGKAVSLRAWSGIRFPAGLFVTTVDPQRQDLYFSGSCPCF